MKKAWFIGVSMVIPLALSACGGTGTDGDPGSTDGFMVKKTRAG